MRNRAIALILSAVLVCLCFSGCGKDQGSIRADISGNAPTSAPAAEPTAAPTAAPTEAPASPALGTIDGNHYENEYIGIGCDLSQDWTVLTQEQILETNSMTKDMVGDEYKEILDSANILYDFAASQGMNSLSINLERLQGLTQLITEKQYVDACEESTVGSLQSMGMTNIAFTTSEIEFAGKNHWAIRISGDMALDESTTMTIYETMVCIRCGSHMALVTAATWVEDSTMDVLGNFYGLS